MFKRIFVELRTRRQFNKRKKNILQTATNFWNECEKQIKEKEKYGKAI